MLKLAGLCGHVTAALYILYHRIHNKPIPKKNKRTSKTITDLIDLYYFKEAWTAIGGIYDDNDDDIHNTDTYNDNDNTNTYDNNDNLHISTNSNENKKKKSRKRSRTVHDEDNNDIVPLRRSKRSKKR